MGRSYSLHLRRQVIDRIAGGQLRRKRKPTRISIWQSLGNGWCPRSHVLGLAGSSALNEALRLSISVLRPGAPRHAKPSGQRIAMSVA